MDIKKKKVKKKKSADIIVLNAVNAVTRREGWGLVYRHKCEVIDAYDYDSVSV